jgi:hypothetical protein
MTDQASDEPAPTVDRSDHDRVLTSYEGRAGYHQAVRMGTTWAAGFIGKRKRIVHALVLRFGRPTSRVLSTHA